MTLPGFLIIGAMKAGTTTLYRDLMLNPTVFMPEEKEPENLCHDDVFTEKGKRAYEKMFAKAKPNQLCGEASTAYSKLPDFPGVPQRALQLLGKDLKVIYLVRHPITRLISQHHHEITSGRISCNIDEAVQTYSRFIDFSKYAMQIKPWIETLGSDNVMIVHFETYIKERSETVELISRFIGVEPQIDDIDQGEIYNKTQGKPMPRGLLEKIRLTPLYRQMLRPLLTSTARDRIRGAILPQAKARPTAPTKVTTQFIKDQIDSDIKELTNLMQSEKLLWN